MPENKSEEFVPEQMTEKEIARAMGAEVVSANRRFTDDDYRGMQTWEDVVRALGDDLDFADEELGDGFSVLGTDNKAQLIGIPLIFIEWRFVDGDMGEFVLARVAATFGKDNTRFLILTDGSTGIMGQLKAFTSRRGRSAGLVAKRGLRRSDYTVFDEKLGKDIPATTFYIDTQAA